MVHWISTYAKIRWRLGLKTTYTSQPRAVKGAKVRIPETSDPTSAG